MLLLIDEAIGLVNTELRILNMRIKYPVQFQNRKNSLPSSPLHLTDETYLIEIMELVSGLFLSKRVVTHIGTESPLTEIGKAFEYLFGSKATIIYRVIFIVFILGGATMSLDLAWDLSDTFNGLMAIPNLIGVVTLSPIVCKITKNYVERRIKGKDLKPMLSAFPEIQAMQEKNLNESD